MKKIFILSIIVLFCLVSANAQKRKGRKATKAKVEEVIPEKTPQELLFEELLPATAQIMFIDSVIVDKASFLEHLRFPHEMGRIVRENEKVYYTNEFGNTQIIASTDNMGRFLYSAHKYGSNWDKPIKLTELGKSGNDYPFLMTDGVTLYFSADGDNTIGGRDIFRTTFDAEDSRFYDAVNMGLPFNSPANDYLLAISDYDNIGWLVSDRFQPENKVCIYTFEPTQQRRTFSEDTDSLTIMSCALVNSIKDTWQFGDRNSALGRIQEMQARMKNKQTDDKVYFVVNDNITYTSLSDFKNDEDKTSYKQLAANRKKLEQTKKLLAISRDSYAEADSTKKISIGRNIRQLEEEADKLEEVVKKEEKLLRISLNK